MPHNKKGIAGIIVGPMTRVRTRAWPSFQRGAAIFLASATIAACDAHGISNPGTLATLTVSPVATLISGSSVQLIAVGRDASGRVIAVTPTWSVAARGGTVSANGMFTAGAAAGFFANTAVATVGSISGSASITVVSGAIATITVVPNPATLAVAATQQFFATAKDASGNLVQFLPTWSVVAGGGTIDSAGNFTGGATPGTYASSVQASHNGITGFATVNVTAGPLGTMAVLPGVATMVAGAKQQFSAVGKDASGNSVPIAATWTVVSYGGTIDQGGLFTAGTVPGTYAGTIQATSGTLTATATVVLTAGPLSSISVTPSPVSMAINSTQQFTAIGKDAGGNVVAIAPAWSVVTASNGASITPAGLYTAGTVTGTFVNKVRATSGGVSGYATITGTAGPLATITVAPNPVSMQSDGTHQFTAIGSDANGNVFVLAPVWAVVNGGGSINPTTGAFTAGRTAGTFSNTVQATSGAITGTATVTVTSAPPVGIITTFETFSVGAIDGQQDWQSYGGLGALPPANPIFTHCAVYDQVIADNTAAAATYSYPAFGAKSLRISNAVTSGCFTDNTFSSRTAHPAGQAGARTTSTNGLIDYALAGGVLQDHFEAEWSFASTVPGAQQPGLQVTVSPARGDNLRMGWVQMTDLSDGLAVIFGEWVSTVSGGTSATGAPRLTTVAHGLDRHVPHTILISMNFLAGPNNDVVQLYVDDVLAHTGTSWENYYTYDALGQSEFGGAPPIVNRLLFRTGGELGRGITGVAAPATLGYGFVIDNLRQATFMVGSAADVLTRNMRARAAAAAMQRAGSRAQRQWP